jgi:hypothetical protein
MLSRVCLAMSCALCALPLARADEVRVWDATGTYSVAGPYVTITGPGTFKVEGLDGSGGLGHIAKIDVQFIGHASDVTVYVVRDPSEVGGSEHEPGATEVWQIDLSGAMTPGYSGTVAELRTTGNYGHTTDGGTLNASAAGDIHIGGDVVMPSTITTAIDIAGAITQPLTIGGQLLAGLTCESADDITIAGDVLSPIEIARRLEGPLTVGGALRAHLSIDWGSAVGASIAIAGDAAAPIGLGTLRAPLTIGGVLSASLDCADLRAPISLTAAGVVHTGDLTVQTTEVEGEIDIAGSHAADIVLGTFCGDMYCAGSVHKLSFRAGTAQDADIVVVGSADSVGVGPNGQHEGYLAVVGDVGQMTVVGISAAGDIHVGSDLGGGFLGSVADLAGDFIVNGTLTGALTIFRVSGTVQLGGMSEGAVLLAGEFPGTLSCDEMSGSIQIANLAETALVDIGTSTGHINFGRLSGVVEVDELDGNILVAGAFDAAPTREPRVIVTSKSAGALFVVNADGQNECDDFWMPHAEVQIGEDIYDAPAPEIGLATATCGMGDMNNDGLVNGYDIDPFVLALTNLEAYYADYPYLQFSMPYRADMDCDELVTGFDIDPFVLRLTEEIHPWCEVCPGLLGLGAGEEAAMGLELPDEGSEDPAIIAAFLAANLSPENMPAMIETAQMLATGLEDPDRAELWAGIAAALSGE